MTTIAMGFAEFTKNYGGTVCYAIINVDRHLESIAEMHDCDSYLFCGTNGRWFKAVEFSEALKAVRSASPKTLNLAPNPD
jgi:hypothetical protein